MFLGSVVSRVVFLRDRQYDLLIRLLKPFRPDPMVRLQRKIFEELERALQLDQTHFPEIVNLPPSYGKGMPERVVELIYAKLSYRTGIKVLDVGHANAMKCHLDMIRTLPGPRRLTGMDIAHPSFDVCPYYRQSVRSDITKAAFEDAAFDLIWCISSLEHLGMDNSGYTRNFTREEDMDAQAIKEMLRILARGGVLLITVPFGRYEDHGWLKNYDKSHWQQLLDVARSQARVREAYFRHTYGAGWVQVEPEELQCIGYYDQANAGAGGLAVAFIHKG